MSRTIEDVVAVAGNRPVFQALVSILEAGKAIALVGAGASAGMYPLWGRFIEEPMVGGLRRKRRG